MIEAQLGRKCTEDECKDIKHDLYNMHGEEGDQERAEAVLDAEDAEKRAVGFTSGHKIDKDHTFSVVIDGEEEGTYHSLEQAKAVLANRKKVSKGYGPRKFKIVRNTRTGAFTSEDGEGAEDAETVTENFENQQHLNVTTTSTSMYLTEQVSKDKRNGSQNKKSSNQSQSFKERYKPKTHWQLEELRRYGL
jgi:hypothetical protein